MLSDFDIALCKKKTLILFKERFPCVATSADVECKQIKVILIYLPVLLKYFTLK